MAASLKELMVAVFNGAPTPEAAALYSAQITSLISLYICLVAVFLVGLYMRASRTRAGLSPAQRDFRFWIAFALMATLLMIAANLLYFYFQPD
jgi:H+/Cl- antiporter ClcA